MGVGAIFISTLALTELQKPQYPPQNQQQLLASVLQPIVSFVVLGAIVIRECSDSLDHLRCVRLIITQGLMTQMVSPSLSSA